MYTSHIDGWMSNEELFWLHCNARGMGSVLEVGCWKGRSTQALLTACPGVVYAVDHFRGDSAARHDEATAQLIKQEFLNNVGHHSNLHLYHMSSEEAAKIAPDVDMIFIDGGHSYEEVMSDLHLWVHKARLLISGHDYAPEWPGVVHAVYDYFQRPPHLVGSIWHYWKG